MAKFYTLQFWHQAEKEFGAGQATEKATRAVGALQRFLQGGALQHHPSFPHIAEHFHEQPDKKSHGVFVQEYHAPQKLAALILRAIQHPGTEPMLSKSDDGSWAVVIQTWLGAKTVLGYQSDKGQRKPLSYLCVIADLRGDLITAYPVDEYRRALTQVAG